MEGLGAVVVFMTYATAAVGGIAFLLGIIRGWRPNSGPKIVLLLAYLPFAFLAANILWSEVRAKDEQNKYGFIGLTQEALREYYQVYPDRFRRKGTNEEAEVLGFSSWFGSYLKERKGNWPEITRQFRFQNGQLLDREGYPVEFAVDFDRDYAVSAFGQRVQIDPPTTPPSGSPPSDRYVTTLGALFPPDTTIRYQTILKE
jgi:hypothetical protein